MIEPPRLFTDARKEYDLSDVEVLAKFTIELNLQSQPHIKSAFERLIELVGTPQFYKDYGKLHDTIMQKRAQCLSAECLSSKPISNAISLVLMAKSATRHHPYLPRTPSKLERRLSGSSTLPFHGWQLRQIPPKVAATATTTTAKEEPDDACLMEFIGIHTENEEADEEYALSQKKLRDGLLSLGSSTQSLQKYSYQALKKKQELEEDIFASTFIQQ